MCGRFSLAVTETEIRHQFAIEKVAINLTRYNIAPSQDIWTLDKRKFICVKFTLIETGTTSPLSHPRK